MAKKWRTVHGYTHYLAAQEAEMRAEMPAMRAVWKLSIRHFIAKSMVCVGEKLAISSKKTATVVAIMSQGLIACARRAITRLD